MEPLPHGSSLLHPHYRASGFPRGISWTIAYSGCYSTHRVPLHMFPDLEGKLVKYRTERGGWESKGI